MTKTLFLLPLFFCCTLLPAGEGHSRPPLPSPEEIAKLPADGGPKWNRLVFQKSPYLLQHAANPVDWYPWGKEAFDRARLENKPIFLSIGYSTCHWCHVMERESFEDAEVAALLNKTFVCIKVDREERPDVDKVYMAACQAMTGQGGWPLTAFLTPDKKPWFTGTYFPKTSVGQRLGLMDLIPRAATAWADQGEQLLAQADKVVEHLKESIPNTAGDGVDSKALTQAFNDLRGTYDSTYGGFGSGNKFPLSHRLTFLMRYGQRSGEAEALEMVEETLQKMRRGGIWDHIGYGFHRYATDVQWLLPHFEKMLYDQAQLALAYLEAYQLTDKQEYAQTARKIFHYVNRMLVAPEGGFYSAEDADSDGEEGKFYVWKISEVKQILGEEEGALFAKVYNMTEEGNFRDEATGQLTGNNILHLLMPLADKAAMMGLKPEDLAVRVETSRKKLLSVQARRIRPQRDNKILTDWNGLMIAAFARGAVVLDAPEYALVARKAADFLLSTLRSKEGRLYKRYASGKAGLSGHLEDYAFTVWGMLELYEATFDTRYLEAAINLNNTMVSMFWDGESGGLFLSASDSEELFMKSKDVYDGAIPSGNSVAALNLLRISRMTGEALYEETAHELFKAFGATVSGHPSAYTLFLHAVDFATGPSYEVVVVGEKGSPDTRAMLKQLNSRYLPNKVVLLKTPGSDALDKLAPYTVTQGMLNKKATLYLCQNFACKKPTADPKVVTAMLAELGKK